MKHIFTLCFVLLVSVSSGAASQIAAHSPTAGTSETFVLTGSFTGSETVRTSDGTTLSDCDVLLEDTEKIMAAIPDDIGTGTLWVWLVDGANSVTLNNPEPWWIQPDVADRGDTLRLFGRNIAKGSSPSLTILLESVTTQTSTYRYTATVTEPCVAQFILTEEDDTGTSIPYDTFKVYVDEPKTSGFNKDYELTYGDTEPDLTVQAAQTIPATIANIADYGAVANDGNADTTAIVNALADLNTSGGGTLQFGAGVWEFDASQYNGATGVAITVPGLVRLTGAGKTATELRWHPQTDLLTPPDPIVLISCASSNYNEITSLSLTIQGEIDAPPTGREYLLAGHCLIDNVLFSGDGSRVYNWYPLYRTGYCDVQNCTFYAEQAIYTASRQNRVSTSTFYGPKDFSEYDNPTYASFGSQVFSPIQAREQIYEYNTVLPRQGPLRRFLVTQGAAHRMYRAHNYALMESTAGSNEAEIVAHEALRFGSYIGGASAVGTVLTLDSGISTSGLMTTQEIAPLSVIVSSGTAFGQTRTGKIRSDGVTIDMDSTFTMGIDSGSTVVVGVGPAYQIDYDNDFVSTSSSPVACHAFSFYGCGHDSVISSNSVTNCFVGVSLTNALGGAFDPRQSVIAWMVIEDNIFTSCTLGIVHPFENAPASGTGLGAAIRRNTVGLSYQPNENGTATYAAFGANTSDLGDAGAGDGVYCEVIEDNTVEPCLRPFYSGKRWGQWWVLRRNSMLALSDDPTSIASGIVYFAEMNTTDSLPVVDITATTSLAYRENLSEYQGTGTWSPYLMVWSDSSGGSITVTLVDPENDAASTISAVSGGGRIEDGSTSANCVVEWSGLTNGINKIDLTVGDGIGTYRRSIYVMSGGLLHERMTTVTSLVENPTSYTGWSLTTSESSYETSRVACHLAEANWQNLTNPAGILRIFPINQTMVVRPATLPAHAGTAGAVALLDNLWATDGKRIRLRLCQDDSNYYEVSDVAGSTNLPRTRWLAKIAGGNTETSVSLNASHSEQGFLGVDARGGEVTGYAWGDILSFTDGSPLYPKYWEIAYRDDPGTSSYDYIYSDLDELWFTTGTAPVDPVPDTEIVGSTSTIWVGWLEPAIWSVEDVAIPRVKW